MSVRVWDLQEKKTLNRDGGVDWIALKCRVRDGVIVYFGAMCKSEGPTILAGAEGRSAGEDGGGILYVMGRLGLILIQ